MAGEELLLKIGVQADTRSLSSLNKEFNALSKATKTLNSSLKTGGASLDSYKQKQQNLTRQLELLGEKQSRLKDKLADYNKQLEENRKKYDEIKNSAGDHTKELEKLDKGYQQISGNINTTQAQLQQLNAQVKSTTTELTNCSNIVNNFGLQKLSQQLQDTGKKITDVGEKFKNAGKGIEEVGKTITNTFLPIAGAGLLAAKSAIDFETSWTSVLKTTTGTEQQFQALQEGLLAMSETIPMSVNDLNELASVGSQLGIPIENLQEFTEVIANLGVTTNISAEEGAVSLAQFMNICQMDKNEVENLGSAIVDLGNNFATNEATILEFAQRIAGVSSSINMSEQDMLGFSTAMASVGINAQAGGTAFSTVMSDIQMAVSEGGESLQKFAQVSGMSVEEFSTKFKEDAGEAMYSFIDGLGNIKESGGDVISTLVDLGFSETRVRDMLSRLAGNTDLVRNALDMSNEAWEENTALQDEASLRYGTTASQMEIAKNKIQNVGISIGQALLPSINDMLDKLGEAVEWFGNLDPELSASIIKFSTMAVGVGLLTTGIGKLVSGIGTTVKTVGGFVTGLGKLTDVTKTTGKAITSLSTFTRNLIPGLSSIGTTATGGASALGTLATAALPVVAVLATVAAGVYTYHEYNEALNDSLLKTTDEMSWLEEGFRKLNNVQSYSKEELENMNLVYEDFNENISPEFREKVEEMRKSISEFNMDLAIFSADGIFGDDEIEQLKNNFNEGVDQSIENIKNRKEEVQNTWTETFLMDDNTVDENEQTLINFWNKNYDTSITEIEKMQADVNELFRKRIEEGYQFTPEDEAMIREYYEKVHQIELECMVNNQEEELFAKNKFKTQVATMDAESASKLGQERKKTLENDLAETEAYYDTQIEMLETHYDEMNEQEKAAADIELAQLRSEKEAKVQAKREEINAIYDEMVAGNENLKGVIDRFTLEVFEGESKVQNDRLNKTKSHYKGLEEITTDGMHKMYNEQTKSWEDVTVTVDEATGEITGMIRSYTDENGRHIEEVCGYNEEYKKSTQELADRMAQDYTRMAQQIKNESDAHVDSNGNIINSNGELIGSLEQVVDENGNVTTSVKDLNGNPIDINDNTGDVINGLENTAHELNNLDGKNANVSVTTHYYEVTHQGLFSNTQKGYGYKNGQAGYWEQGTHGDLGAEQLGHINEKARQSRGWELVDGPATYLGTDSIGDKVLLGQGASVKNNLASTQMMLDAVKEEVQRQIANTYFDYGMSSSTLSRMAFNFGNPQQTVNNNMTFDDSNLANLLITLIGAVQGQNMSPVINLNAKSIAKATAPYIDKELQWRAKKR